MIPFPGRKLHTAAERREKKEENSILCMFRLDFAWKDSIWRCFDIG